MIRMMTNLSIRMIIPTIVLMIRMIIIVKPTPERTACQGICPSGKIKRLWRKVGDGAFRWHHGLQRLMWMLFSVGHDKTMPFTTHPRPKSIASSGTQGIFPVTCNHRLLDYTSPNSTLRNATPTQKNVSSRNLQAAPKTSVKFNTDSTQINVQLKHVLGKTWVKLSMPKALQWRIRWAKLVPKSSLDPAKTNSRLTRV